eukprot:TRINITY_DN37529_c0_g1_i1.p1 TRINITY_DN37529_c0_g1~~TRINITY_DN37529_c0_g1_i1.p1  ORF type:complete len:159 (-),score=58.46 TRINITY_DN37529_c0_g1_i1:4-456(-)
MGKEVHSKDELDDKENDKFLNNIFEGSTEVNHDESSEYQSVANEVWPMTEEDTPDDQIMAEEDISDTVTRQFTLKLGAGPRSIKLTSKSSGLSGPPVLSQHVEGLEEVQLGDLGGPGLRLSLSAWRGGWQQVTHWRRSWRSWVEVEWGWV